MWGHRTAYQDDTLPRVVRVGEKLMVEKLRGRLTKGEINVQNILTSFTVVFNVLAD